MTRQSNDTDELSELLAVLGNPHRRRILTRLNAHNPRDDDEFDLETVAGGAAFDDDTINLIHNHLPRLVDAGLVDWDRERLVVRRGPRFHEMAPVVDLMVAHRDELPADWL